MIDFILRIRLVAGLLFAYGMFSTVGCVAHAEAAATYTVFLADTARGTFSVQAQEGGGVRTVTRYTDRFGVNEITGRFRVDTRGMLRDLQISGRDSYGRPIEERYAVMQKRAQWKSDTDSGSASPDAFYLPSKFDAEHLAAMARALLAAPDHALDILPLGRARIEALQEETVAGPGGSRQVRLYFIHGLDVRPMPVWLDASRQLFAAGSARMSYIVEGYEASRPALLARQASASMERAMRVAREV